MERVIECMVLCSDAIVPLLAVWAIACLYTARNGGHAHKSQAIYFTVLLMIAGITVRTVMADDGCWLAHTASLGVMIVTGVMRRPHQSELLVGM